MTEKGGSEASTEASVTRDVLDRAVQDALASQGYLGTPLADLAKEVLRLEIDGIDNRGETQPQVMRVIERWANENSEWMNSREGEQ